MEYIMHTASVKVALIGLLSECPCQTVDHLMNI